MDSESKDTITTTIQYVPPVTEKSTNYTPLIVGGVVVLVTLVFAVVVILRKTKRRSQNKANAIAQPSDSAPVTFENTIPNPNTAPVPTQNPTNHHIVPASSSTPIQNPTDPPMAPPASPIV